MRFHCDVHGDLALRMLRGEVEDRPELRECPGCREVLDGVAAAPWAEDVAAGVAEGFASLVLPARRRRRTGMLVAAAVLAAAAALTVLPRFEHERPHRAAAPEVVGHLFDGSGAGVGDLNRDGRVDAADLALALRGGGAPTPRS